MKTIIVGWLTIMAVLAASGCGNSDRTAFYDPETSAHPADWLPAQHASKALDNRDNCRQCHGQDLTTGGIARVSCTECHIGSPFNVHPEVFDGEPWIRSHGAYTVANGLGSCRNVFCHGPNLQGVPLSGPSCEECHSFP